MSTSDMYSAGIKRWRVVYAYALAALALVLANALYAQFSHGVRSDAMAWAFLYPLLGGFLPFALLLMLYPAIAGIGTYRLCVNLHGAGIATLAASAFLRGVMEIAGTTSPYPSALALIGWIFVGCSVVALLITLFTRRM